MKATKSITNLVKGLPLVVLIIAGTVLYLGLAPSGEESSVNMRNEVEGFHLPSEQGGTQAAALYPDTEYYRDSEYQERKAAKELPGGNGTLWVTNKALNNMTAYDSATGEVLGTIPVGDKPIGVTAPPGTGKVYVSNEGSNSVSVIDKSKLSVIATIPTGDGPHHIVHSPNGKFVYVAEFNTNTIGVIDTDSDTLVAQHTASEAEAGTHAVGVTQDGKRLYAANSDENTIAALDAQTGELLWSLDVGANPSEILVTPDGETGYVTVRDENKVKVVDLTVPEIIDEVVVGDQPDTLQLTPDLKTLVVALRGTPAQVALVDTATLAVTPVDITTGQTTGHHWLSANGRYTFVAVEDPGSIAVILNSDAKVVASYPYPESNGESGQPHGVFYESEQLK